MAYSISFHVKCVIYSKNNYIFFTIIIPSRIYVFPLSPSPLSLSLNLSLSQSLSLSPSQSPTGTKPFGDRAFSWLLLCYGTLFLTILDF